MVGRARERRGSTTQIPDQTSCSGDRQPDALGRGTRSINEEEVDSLRLSAECWRGLVGDGNCDCVQMAVSGCRWQALADQCFMKGS